MISYEKAIEVLRALQRDAYAIDLLKGETGPDFREAVEITNKKIVDALLDLDLDSELNRKSPLDSQIRTASARAAENRTPERAMTAIREGYGEFALYPNEDLEGITLVHGGGQVKVNDVVYDLHKPLSMSDCIKMDQIPYRPERYKVDDYFRDPYEPYR